jgi:hypothetical protein
MSGWRLAVLSKISCALLAGAQGKCLGDTQPVQQTNEHVKLTAGWGWETGSNHLKTKS